MVTKSHAFRTLALAILMVIIGYGGFSTYLRGGLEFRLPKLDFNKYVHLQNQEIFPPYGSAEEFVENCDFIFIKTQQKNRTFIAKNCFTKDPLKSDQIFLWGDSYAQMLTYGLLKNLPNNLQLLQIASRGCHASIFESTESKSDYCKQSNYFAIETIAKIKPKVVIISQNSEMTKENAQLFSSKLHHLGVEHIIFVGKPPEWNEHLPKVVHRKMSRPTPVMSKVELDQGAANLGSLLSTSTLGLPKEDIYLNLIKYLCDATGCLVYTGNEVERGITALDGRHLTPAASDLIAREKLIPQIQSFP